MISDKPHPNAQSAADRLVTWYAKATVTGYGTDPVPYVILRIDTGGHTQYLHVPMTTYESINEWPMRSNVNLRVELDNLP
jgi:hypothetical protein